MIYSILLFKEFLDKNDEKIIKNALKNIPDAIMKNGEFEIAYTEKSYPVNEFCHGSKILKN